MERRHFLRASQADQAQAAPAQADQAPVTQGTRRTRGENMGLEEFRMIREAFYTAEENGTSDDEVDESISNRP